MTEDERLEGVASIPGENPLKYFRRDVPLPGKTYDIYDHTKRRTPGSDPEFYQNLDEIRRSIIPEEKSPVYEESQLIGDISPGSAAFFINLYREIEELMDELYKEEEHYTKNIPAETLNKLKEDRLKTPENEVYTLLSEPPGDQSLEASDLETEKPFSHEPFAC